MPGNAVSFNGSTDYGYVNNSAELNVTNNGSWEFWINRSATSDETLLSKTSDYLNNGFYISLSSGVVYFAQGNGGAIITTIASIALPLNEWCHVAIVKNGASCTIYLNGVNSTGTQGSHVAIVSSTAELRFGKHNDNSQLLFGEMDEIRIWTVIRSPKQILDNMNMRLGGNENGLVGYWQFDEAIGTTVRDASGNNNECTLANVGMHVESGAKIYNPEGPGGVGGINGLSKLCLWLKASSFTSASDGLPVSIWTDISGYNHHFTPNSTPNFVQNAQNNQPAILFDGTDDYFAIANSQVLNPTSMSVFAVANPTGFAEENDIISLWGDYPSYVFGVYQNKLYVNFETTGGSYSVQNGTNLSGWTLMDATWLNKAYLFENGDFVAESSEYVGALSQNLTGEIRIGGLQYTTEYFWDGHIAEVIMFSQSVTDSEQVILQNYLSAKYAIPITPTVIDKFASSTYTQDLAGIGMETTFIKNTAFSAGLLLMDNGFLNDAGDYVMAGHNSPGNSIAYDALPANIQMRWERIWNIERTEGGAGSPNNILIAFDFEKSGFEFIAGDPQDYSLLFRPGTTGNFTIKPTVSTRKRENTIIFEIASNQLATGYYSIGGQVPPDTNGPGGVGSTDGTSALSLWLKADTITTLSHGEALTQWADTSGNNHIFSAINTTTFQENIQNGHPAIYFDGTDGYLKMPNRQSLNPEEMSVFAVVDYDGSSTEHEIISLWNLNNDLMASYAIGVINDQGYATFVSEGGMTSVQNTTHIGTDWTMIDVSWSRLTGETYAENGEIIGQNNLFTGPLKRNQSDEIRIGAVNYASPYVWKGHISEIIMYTVPLNNAQKTIVQNYLSAKYTIALTPTSLDKYTSTTFDKDVIGVGREDDGKKAISSASGLVLMDRLNFLNDPGDYVMAGHAQSENTYSWTNLSGSIERRWSRTWYIDKTEASNPPTDTLTIGFDFSDSGINSAATNPQDYTLLYRSNTNDNFSAFQGINVSKVGDQILFQVSNTDLQDGYYTIGYKKGAPFIGDIITQSTPAGSSLSIPVNISDVDNAPCSLNLTLTSSNETLVPIQNISYTCSAGSYMISITPASTQSGYATITITVEDSEGLTSSSHFLVVFSPPSAGNALDFDGVDDYVVTMENYTWPNTFSIMAWIYMESYPTVASIISAGQVAGESNCVAEFRVENQKLQYGQSTGTFQKVSSNETIKLNKWYHVAVVKNEMNVGLYINGKPDNTISLGYIDSNVNVAIGIILTNGMPYASNYYFDGRIDELSFWRIPLTLQDIRDHMCKRVSNFSNLIAYYRFDHDSGTSLLDLSGNGKHGTLSNMTNEDWILSGAAIGDVSIYDYTGSVFSDFVVHLASSNGDQFTAIGDGGTYTGLQLFLVNESPNITTPPSGWTAIDTDHYWGVFPVGSSSSFNINYHYSGNSFIDNENRLQMAEREDNSINTWSSAHATLNTTAHSLNFSSYSRVELILGSTSIDISTISSQSIAENTTLTSIAFSITDTGSAPCSLTIIVDSSNTVLVPTENISYICNSGNYTITAIPATGQSGLSSITVTAIAPDGLSSSTSFDLTVFDLPDISSIENQETVMNSSISIAFQITGTESLNLLLSATSSNLTLLANENISFSSSNIITDAISYTLTSTPGVPETITITFVPSMNATGNSSITIQVNDNGNIVEKTFELSVLPLFTTDDNISISGVFRSAVAFGDIDNDGDLDLVLTGDIANYNKISKVYRNIDGDFIEDTGISLTPVMFGAVAFGDIDNDGDLDILLTGYTGIAAIAKIYQNNGGSFIEDTSIDLAGVQNSAAAFGDYDNDGDLDILICGQDNNNNNISKVYQNNNGSFDEDTGITLAGVGNYPSAVFGDYDNDGDLDILLTGQDSDYVRQSKLYKNTNGYYTEDTASSLTGVDNSSAAFGDYDNDGDLDILLAGNTGSTRIAVIYENTGGVFSVNNNITLPAVDTGTAAFGDYDNDGDLDILITGYTGVAKIANIYENTGGNFILNTDITFENCFTGQSLFGDYDNDGDLDILLTGADDSNTKIAKIYRNNTCTSNTPPSEPTGLNAVVQGENVLLSWSAASDAETITSTGLSYNLSIGSSPGSSDILAPMALPLSNGYRQIAERGTIQQLTATVTIDTPGTYYWRVQAIDTALSGSPFSSEYSFTVTDIAPTPGNNGAITYAPLSLDNSNILYWETASDAVTLSSSLEYRLYTSTNNFGNNIEAWETNATAISNWTANTTTATIASLNEKSNYYIIVIVRDPTGNKSAYQALSIEAFSDMTVLFPEMFNFPHMYTIEFFDFDNDADLDILVTGYDNSTKVARIYQNSDGEFSEYTGITLAGVSSSSTAIGDYDTDGDLDILITGVDNDSNTISKLYENTGGNFSEYTEINLTDVSSGAVAFADYDTDGDLDILLTGFGGGNLAKIYQNTSGHFAEYTTITLTGVSSCSVKFGDIDNDGDLDLILAGDSGTGKIAKVYENSGNNFIENAEITLEGFRNGSLDLGDYDNDGDLDLLLTGWDTSYASIAKLYQNTTGNFNEQTGVNLSGVDHGLGLFGDYDNDGDLDIFISGHSSFGNILKIYRNTNGNFIQEAAATHLMGISNSALALGDYDNDGDLDIVFSGEIDGGNTTKFYRNNLIGNTPPSIPTALNAEVSGQNVRLSWSAASDSETITSAGLNYNVYIGSTPQGMDILSPMALPLSNGYRMISARGTIQTLTATVKNLNDGTYYWGVQAIDTVFAGSEFSTEGTFTIGMPEISAISSQSTAANTTLTSIAFSITDTGSAPCSLTLTLSSSNETLIPNQNISYTCNNNQYTLTIAPASNQSGSSTITIVVLDADGLTVSTSFDVTVNSAPTITSISDVALSQFLEDFSSTSNADLNATTANWSISDGLLKLSAKQNRYHAFSENTVGADITSYTDPTSALIIGDMDGDGDMDLITGSAGHPLRLYLNNGTAAPYSGVTGQNITSDNFLASDLALADLNYDGHLDVISGNYGVKNRIYLNNGTSNPFDGITGSNVTDYTSNTEAIILIDINNDDNLDIIEGNEGQVNYVYINNGTADPFNGVTPLTITSDIDLTQDIAVGDVNNDGFRDVVVANESDVNKLYLNNGTDDPFNGVSAINITNDSYDTEAIALKDMNGDGYLDVVCGNTNQVNTLYIHNQTADPFNGVSAMTITSDTNSTKAIAVYDINNDGHFDLIEGNSLQTNYLYLNNGTSEPFSNITRTAISNDTHDTRELAIADMDNDGDIDIVAGNNNFPSGGEINRLYLNQSTSNPFEGITGTEITDTQSTFTGLVVADINGDSYLDIIASNSIAPNVIYIHNGTSDPFNGVTGTYITADSYTSTVIAVSDIDGDGYFDVIVGNKAQPNRYYLNNGTADPFYGITGVNISDETYDTRVIAVADVNGDGLPDVISGNYNEYNRISFNTGTSTPYESATRVSLTHHQEATRTLVIEDIDLDGDMDIIVGNYGQENRIHLNNGTDDPFYGESSLLITTDTDQTTVIAVGDMDNDGDMDVIVGNDNQVNKLYLNNGRPDPFNGVSGQEIGATGFNTISLKLVDIDGDGDLDVLEGNASQANKIYLNNGTSSPFSGVIGLNIQETADNTVALDTGDLNNDGTPDLVVFNENELNHYFLTADVNTSITATAYDTVKNFAHSIKVCGIGRDRAAITIEPALPDHTDIELYFSSDDTKYYRVQQNRIYNFPDIAVGDMSEGLYWSARLNTLSPAITPEIDYLLITWTTLNINFDISDDLGGLISINCESSNQSVLSNEGINLAGTFSNAMNLTLTANETKPLSLTLIGNPGQTGTSTVTITVTDPLGLTRSSSFVATLNDKPMFSNIPDIVIDENSGQSKIPFEITNNLGTVTSVMATSSDQTLIPNGNLSIDSNGNQYTLNIQANSDQYGTATITIFAADDLSENYYQTIDVTVNPVNIPPESSLIANVNEDEDTIISIPFVITDTDGGMLVVSSSANNLTLFNPYNVLISDSNSDKNPLIVTTSAGDAVSLTVLLTPESDQFGISTISLTVTDSEGLTHVQNFSVTINSVEDAPVIGLYPTIDAGDRHSIALNADGTVWTWGNNNHGQLGDGTIITRSTPVKVKNLSDVIDVSAGESFSVALKNDGSVWAWGWNSFGMIGNDTTDDTLLPAQVLGESGVGYLTNVVSIACGNHFVLAVKDDGSTWSWGCNGSGKLGDNSFTNRYTPVRVVGSGGVGYLSNIIDVAAGDSHSLALDADGNVWAWGSNLYGQLGDGSYGGVEPTPVQGINLSHVKAIAAGNLHSVALKTNGSVWTWGDGTDGQLGDNGWSYRYRPYHITSLSPVESIAAGGDTTVVLKANGTAWGFGKNSSGQLGNGNTTDQHTPIQLSNAGYIRAIAVGGSHVFIVKKEGEVWACGRNLEGQLGDESLTNQETAVQVHGLYDVDYLNLFRVNRDVHVDAIRYLINDAEGGPITLVGVSYNQSVMPENGMNLGAGTNPYSFTSTQLVNYIKPIDLTPGAGVTGQATIAIGVQDAIGLTNVNVILLSVNDIPYMSVIDNMTIGQNATTGAISFTVSDSGTSVTDLVVTAESSYTSLIPDANIVISGTTSNRTFAITPVSDQTGASYITLTLSDGNASFSRSFTLTVNGYPSIGSIQNQSLIEDTASGPINFTATDGETDPCSLTLTIVSSDPTVIPAYNITSSCDSGDYTLSIYPALNQYGTSIISVTVTDSNGFSDSVSFDLTITAVEDAPQVSQIVSVASGGGHHLALKANGTVFAWGLNTNGQLGNGSTTEQHTPVPVRGLTNVKAVFAGNNHSMALKHDGTLWAWGSNANGQLGDNSTTERHVPVQVSGINLVTDVSLGTFHSLAITRDQTLWAWGQDSYGRLGITPGADQLVPAQVKGVGGTGFLTDVIQASASDTHSMALCSNGNVYIWGHNGNSKLGIGPSGDQNYPVRITQLTNVKDIGVGYYHSVALKHDGSVWSWGKKQWLGVGNISTDQDRPVQILGLDGNGYLTDVIDIVVGDEHTLAIKSDTTVWGWGRNESGRIGDGQIIDRFTPVEVEEFNGVTKLTNILSFDAGTNNSIFVKPDGQVWACGNNTNGSVGDNTTNERRNMRKVLGWKAIGDFRANVINQNDQTRSVHLTLADPEGNDVTLIATSSDNSILPYTCIELCNSSTNTCMLTTTSQQTATIPIEITTTSTYGMITITVDAMDSTGLTSSYAFQLIVNSAPTITGLGNLSIGTNSSEAIAFTVSDNETSNLVLSKESSDLSLISLENIVISGTGTSRTLTITPTTNQSGSATLTISVIDGDTRIFETFDITVLSPFTENMGITLTDVYYGSVAFGDYDNDGDLDILLTGSGSSNIAKVYRNTGGSFSEDTGISLPGVYRSSAVFGDYDNDGDLDILLTGLNNSTKIAKVYQNTGGSFSENTGITLPGVDLSSAAFGDYDNDGDLDILLTGDTGSLKIAKVYRNTDGNFSEDTGITLSGVYSGSVAFADYDNDGDLDILVTGHTGSTGSAKVYRNTDGHFNEDTGISLPDISSCSVAFGDYDNDGDLDLLIAGNAGVSSKIARVYRNTEGSFSEDTGISLPGVEQSSVAFGDYDNDGDLDILLTGNADSGYIAKIYQNTEGSFSEDTAINLPGVYYSSTAFGDYDNDGDLDILLTGDTGSKIATIYNNNSLHSNTVPSKPSNLTSVVTDSKILLSWSAGSDAETISTTGLNYNLRIGSTPGASDILAPMAYPLSNGYRQIPARGVIQNLTATYHLPEGTYYWSVQTIDTSFAASEFANESTLEISLAPEISTISNQSSTEDTTINAISFMITDTNTSPCSLTITFVSSNTSLIPTENISYTCNASHYTITMIPFENQSGASTITVTVSATDGLTASTSFGITVTMVNDTPTVANEIPDQSVTEGSALTFTFAENTFNDVDSGDSLTYSSTLYDGNSLPTWLSFDAPARTFSGTPTHSDVGTITITVTATDQYSSSVSDAFVITVNSTNGAPAISDISPQTTLENLAVSLVFSLTDTIDGVLSLTGVSSNEVLVKSDGLQLTHPSMILDFNGYSLTVSESISESITLTIAPEINVFGTSEILITIINPSGLSVTESFMLTVVDAAHRSIELDGINDHVVSDIPFSEEPTSALAIEAWIYLYTNTTDMAILTYGNNAHESISFEHTSHNLELRLKNGSNSEFVSLKDLSAQGLPEQQWHHVCVLWNNSQNEGYFYLNGQLRYQDTFSSDAIGYSGSNQLYLGSFLGQSKWFKGKLDEVRIWKTALPITTVREWIFKSLTQSHPYYDQLVAYYPISAVSGLEIFDTFNSNHAYLYENAVKGIGPARSQLIAFNNWLNTNTKNWNDPLNWEAGFVPTVNNPGFTIINAGIRKPELSAPSSVNNLVLTKGAGYSASSSSPLHIYNKVYNRTEAPKISIGNSLTLYSSIDFKNDRIQPESTEYTITATSSGSSTHLNFHIATDDQTLSANLEYAVVMSTYSLTCLETLTAIAENLTPCQIQTQIPFQTVSGSGSGETIRSAGGDYAEVDVELDIAEDYYFNVLVRDEMNNIRVYEAVKE